MAGLMEMTCADNRLEIPTVLLTGGKDTVTLHLPTWATQRRLHSQPTGVSWPTLCGPPGGGAWAARSSPLSAWDCPPPSFGRGVGLPCLPLRLSTLSCRLGWAPWRRASHKGLGSVLVLVSSSFLCGMRSTGNWPLGSSSSHSQCD